MDMCGCPAFGVFLGYSLMGCYFSCRVDRMVVITVAVEMEEQSRALGGPWRKPQTPGLIG
jgi:hypothetical protein